MGTTNFDSVDSAEGYKKGGHEVPVSSIITVTVGEDFDTFVEAMAWAVKMPTVGSGQIQIMLPVGTHYLPEPSELDLWEWSYYVIKNRIDIRGTDMATTIITLPATDDGDNWPSVFVTEPGGFLSFFKVTLDLEVGGYPYTNATLGYAKVGSEIYASVTTMKNADYGFYASGLGYVRFYNSILDSLKVGISSYGGGAEATGTTITNCGVGAEVGNRNGVVILDNCTLTTNTADYSVTLNEIQYDGSYITNGAAALTLKA